MGFEPLSQDEIMGVSTAVESSYNAMAATAASYTYFYCRNANLPNPDKEKFDNTGFLGLQQEGGSVQRSGFVNPPVIEFSGDVDTGIFSVWTRRGLGKADPVPASGDILLADTVFKHHCAMLGNRTAAGRQLPSSTFLFSNGALDYQYGGCVVSQLSAQQDGASTPQYNVGFMGGGMHKELSSISGFGTPTPPAEPDIDNVMDGAETEVEYTTGSQKYLAQIDAGAQQLKSISCTIINNNLNPNDKRGGAKRLDSTDPAKGWVLNYLLHGTRSSQLEFVIGLPLTGTVDELQIALNDTIVTDFIWRMNGDFIDDADEDYRHRVEIIFSKLYFRNVRRTPIDGAEFLTIAGFPVNTLETTNPDWVKVDIINEVETAIV